MTVESAIRPRGAKKIPWLSAARWKFSIIRAARACTPPAPDPWNVTFISEPTRRIENGRPSSAADRSISTCNRAAIRSIAAMRSALSSRTETTPAAQVSGLPLKVPE